MGFIGENICIMGKIRAVLLCYPSLTPLSCQWPSGPLFNSQHALGLEVHAWVLTNRHSQRSFSLCLRYLILRHVCVTSSTPKTPCWDQQKNKDTNSCLQLNLVYFSTLWVYACKCALTLLCTFFFVFLLMWVRCTGIQGQGLHVVKKQTFLYSNLLLHKYVGGGFCEK